MISPRDRRAEHHQDGIADDFIDGAVELEDHLDHRFEIYVQRADDFLRRQRLRECGEAAQVGHENRELAFFAADLETLRRLENAGHDFLGHIAPEGRAHDRVDARQLVVLFGEPDPQLVYREMRLDAGQQFVRIERLTHVVDGTEFERLDEIGGVGLGGEKNDGDFTPRRIGLDVGTGFIAIHHRHHDVEQDEVGHDAAHRLERLNAVGRHHHLIAGRLERGGQRLDVGRGVIDDQKARGQRLHRRALEEAKGRVGRD